MIIELDMSHSTKVENFIFLSLSTVSMSPLYVNPGKENSKLRCGSALDLGI